MLWGKRKPGPTAPRRGIKHFQPAGLALEPRIVLAIDLANIAGSTVTGNPGPYGVLEAGGVNNGGAGFAVADVGDVNNDGYDDILVGAPTIVPDPSNPNLPFIGNGGFSQAYLVFGSAQVNTGTFDWQNLTPDQRIGDLNGLGNLNQNNPLTGAPGFNFDGLKFVAGQSNDSKIGASVAGVGDVNGDGIADFMIGAPGEDGGNGRAYLIYGTTTLTTRTNKTVDLDNTTNNGDLNILTFTNTAANGRSGRSVAGIGDFITDSLPDIAIGAPNAQVNGLSSQGAVYVVSGTVLRNATSRTISLATVGQTGGVDGVILAGQNAGDQAGFAVAGAGNVNNNGTTAGQPIADLLIGAPDQGVTGAINGPGSAYLVYGGTPQTIAGLTQTANNVSFIPLAAVGGTGNGAVPGAIFNGDTLGDLVGHSVTTVGDFNGDGIADFAIGSPGVNGFAGRVNVIYGTSNSSSTGSIVGVFDLGNLPSALGFAEIDGATGSGAGFSLSSVASINADQLPELLIGAPAFNNGAGLAYIIPGNTNLSGVSSLGSAESSPLFGTILSQSSTTGVSYVGSGVAGNLNSNGSGRWIDGDSVPDFVVGAAGFPLSNTNPRNLAGGGYFLEGRFIPVQTPISTTLTSTIGVGQPFAPPFTVDASNPSTLNIYVFSNTASGTPNFVPLRDLDPTTITINGTRFTGATIAADPVDENNDGLQDAIVTISPRSNIGLATSSTTFTLTARTLSTSPNANQNYASSTSIVVNGVNPGGGGLPTNRNGLLGLGNVNAAVPRYGERLLPTPSTLGRLRWKPLPPRVAYNQFLPNRAFAARYHQFFHPTKHDPLGSRKNDGSYRTSTLGRHVFTRGKFPVGIHTGPIHHKPPTIPGSF